MGKNKQFMSLDAFKDLIINDVSFKETITNVDDIIDFDNGTMIVYKQNLNKYFEQYMCKTEDELSDTLWFNYGIFLKIVD
jgi:hypothetical protein